MTTPTAAPVLERAPDGRLQRVLIANRGEIAVRIIRGCRDLGIETVVAHSDADRDSLPVRMADRAVCVGPAAAARSYLSSTAILAAAVALEADAIHPGYGFLAENAGFAEACEAEGIRFIGPRAPAVRRMGDKIEARQIAKAIGVPTVPGSTSSAAPEEIERVAVELGLPVVIKAAAGGGGRGMRLIRHAGELRAALASAEAEARSAFGDGSVYLERYLTNARHVEVQVAFDEHGTGIHLGERDCTIQRRYQKLVEEAPSPALDGDIRERMAEAALRLCREVDYRGVGTVEFLFDQDDGAFYFIEMNTRLQVEHPVTEAVTGLDLVTLQLSIASGAPLPLAQRDVKLNGHAIEYRINAEDPEQAFMPSAGVLTDVTFPMGPGVRVDTHCYAGYRVPPYYDSLLAKVIVSGRTRDEALARSRRALRELTIEGVRTTLPFHSWLIETPDFINSATNTSWTERTFTGSTRS